MKASKLIGIFATEVSSKVQSRMYRAIHREAMKHGYNLVIFSGTFDKITFDKTTEITYKLFGMAENMEFAAIIIHAQSIGNMDMINSLIALGKRQDVPVFCLDCESMGITKENGVIPINPDYKQGFAEGVRHLIEYHNCKKILMLAGARDNKYSDDRIEVYKNELLTHGLEFNEDMVAYGGFWDYPAKIALEEYFSKCKELPDAICSANDSMAITATYFLKNRGIKVPEDILVTGFDGIEDAKLNDPVISTSEPMLEVVAESVLRVIKREEDVDELWIPLRFIPKESCGCEFNDVDIKTQLSHLVDHQTKTYLQNHMLATMQVQLIDCSIMEESIDFLGGALDGVFEGYSHVFCLRNDIEYRTEFNSKFDTMRVFFNHRMLPDANCQKVFSASEIIPDADTVFGNAKPDEVFLVRLIQCAGKVYGYSISKATEIVSNKIKLLGEFHDRATYVWESILRNMHLKQANQKLIEMYERVSEMYIRDTMTGLYNRRGYYEKLDNYIKNQNVAEDYLHIISIDMDGMKHINDNYGHMEGDFAICTVAKSLIECFAHPCICARFGGDEFCVALFTETEEQPSTDKISKKLNDYLNEAITLAGKEYKIGVSVGQAVAKISEIGDMKDIEKLADDYMYMNKRARKMNRVD